MNPPPARTPRVAAIAAQWLPPAALVATVFGLWEGLVRGFAVPWWLLPPPSVIATKIVESRSLLLSHTLVTAEEVLAGFAVARRRLSLRRGQGEKAGFEGGGG